MTFSELPISCYIRTLNEERMIGEVISSAKKICSEVIIIDSLSIDKTKSISLSLGAKVYDQPWLGNGFQKRVGEDKSKNDWVLDIDADELVSDEMVNEIKTYFKNPTFQIQEVDRLGESYVEMLLFLFFMGFLLRTILSLRLFCL